MSTTAKQFNFPTSSSNLAASVIAARGFATTLEHDIAQARAAKSIANFNWSR